MHILTPLQVTLDVYKCIITDTNLPKYDFLANLQTDFTLLSLGPVAIVS